MDGVGESAAAFWEEVNCDGEKSGWLMAGGWGWLPRASPSLVATADGAWWDEIGGNNGEGAERSPTK